MAIGGYERLLAIFAVVKDGSEMRLRQATVAVAHSSHSPVDAI
jgi:hypothetical protein